MRSCMLYLYRERTGMWHLKVHQYQEQETDDMPCSCKSFHCRRTQVIANMGEPHHNRVHGCSQIGEICSGLDCTVWDSNGRDHRRQQRALTHCTAEHWSGTHGIVAHGISKRDCIGGRGVIAHGIGLNGILVCMG